MNVWRADPATRPHLDLAFRRHPSHGTWLDRRMFRWPYTLSRGFRLDTQPAHMLTLIVQTVSGGIAAEDRLSQRIHVGPDAAAHVATQGATPVYRAPTERGPEDAVSLRVEAGGCLEYMPEPRILFPDSRLSQSIDLELADGATAIVADGFVTHDPAGSDRPFRAYQSRTRLRRLGGGLLAIDRLALDGPVPGRGRRAPYVAHGVLTVAVSAPDAWLLALCADMEARLASVPGLYGAATLLPNFSGASVRIAAIDGRHLRLGQHAAWAAARRHLFGAEPPAGGFSRGGGV